MQNISLCDDKTQQSALTAKVAQHSQQMFKMSVVCSGTITEALMPLLRCVVDDTQV